MKMNLKQISDPFMFPFTSTMVTIFLGIWLAFAGCKNKTNAHEYYYECTCERGH